MFVISKESSRIFEILERFALKDMESDFNSPAAGSSLDSVLRYDIKKSQAKQSDFSE